MLHLHLDHFISIIKISFITLVIFQSHSCYHHHFGIVLSLIVWASRAVPVFLGISPLALVI